MIGFKSLKAPEHLGPAGRKEWSRVIKMMNSEGFAGELDRQIIYAYCEAFQEFDELVLKVAKTGPMIKTEKGNYIQSPLLSAKNRASERLVKIAKELGFSPMARARMDIMEKEAEDEFSAFQRMAKSKAAR